MKPLVLIVDDEKNIRRVIGAHLEREGYETVEAESAEEGLAALDRDNPDCVITDLRMPGLGGMELLNRMAERESAPPVIMLTAHGTVQNAVEAMKAGAFDYLTKPFEKEDLIAVVAKALRAGVAAGAEPEASKADAVETRNVAMRSLYALVDKVAKSPTTVLITGESGTGKELIARRLHERGDRADKPYIRVNCAAIPATLVESELFGYDKGAFTGAQHSKPGRFELADKGTLFLDEIGAIPLETQVKLLRALQEQEFERVGGIRTQRVDVRLIAATNVDLKEEVAQGRFREDLYYRLNVVHLRLPPLRERMEDLELLVGRFLDRFNRRLGREVRDLEPEAWGKLRAHPWHGNIRELENSIERAVLLCDGATLGVEDLPEELRLPSHRPAAALGAVGDLKDAARDAAARVEIEMIVSALKKTGGNVTRAARELGLSRKGLQIKMKEYRLDRATGES